MLFNSYSFVAVFLPLTAFVYWLAWRTNTSLHLAQTVLILASAGFIAYGGLVHLGLLVASLTLNYPLIRRLTFETDRGRRNAILAISVALNLLFIGVFKYADFFIYNFSAITGVQIDYLNLPLPLAISFYTFQLIALTVDIWRGEWRCPAPRTFSLFVMFFPQLIAGPIVRLREVQHSLENLKQLNAENIAFGLSLFFVGLFKKVVLADQLAGSADVFFSAVSDGAAPNLLEAWSGTLAYTFQIYFDFSGYSDMAIGLAWFFGIQLPPNFLSPYKARSIVDFWRRWHMTLSRFLRDYLYIPLGGNRRGASRRWINVILTMLIGGLWHGASWNFVLWGGFHGALLALNQAVKYIGVRIPRIIGYLLTFTAVTFSWVLFRSTDLSDALRIYSGMLGMNGIVLPLRLESAAAWLADWVPALKFAPSELARVSDIPLLVLASGIAFLLPNSEEVFRGPAPIFRLNSRWATAIACIGFTALITTYHAQEFVYFRF